MSERWTLHHGDALDVLRGLPDASVDAVVTDPPYGTTERDRGKRTMRGGEIVAFGFAWDATLPLDWLVGAARVLKPGGAVLSFTDNKRIGDLWDAGENAGLRGLHTFYWEKPDPPPTPRPNFASAIESGVFFRKPGPVLHWGGGGWCRNVFRAPLAHKEHDGQTRYHPTEKPLSLMRWLVRTVTPPGGVVLDPFAGSGTTGCAALAEGRRFVGIEREWEHAEMSRARLTEADRPLAQPALALGA